MTWRFVSAAALGANTLRQIPQAAGATVGQSAVGSARLTLAPGVRPMDPRRAVFEVTLAGWTGSAVGPAAGEEHGHRECVGGAAVRWIHQRLPVGVDAALCGEFFAELRSAGYSLATLRAYEVRLRLCWRVRHRPAVRVRGGVLAAVRLHSATRWRTRGLARRGGRRQAAPSLLCPRHVPAWLRRGPRDAVHAPRSLSCAGSQGGDAGGRAGLVVQSIKLLVSRGRRRGLHYSL